MRDLLLDCTLHCRTTLRDLRYQIGAVATACLLALPMLAQAALLPDATVIAKCFSTMADARTRTRLARSVFRARVRPRT